MMTTTIITHIAVDPDGNRADIRTVVMVNGFERWKVASECLDPTDINNIVEEQQTSARVWIVLTIRGEVGLIDG